VVVTDLSSRGFRMLLDEKVRPGHLIALEMDGLSPVNAFVVWQDREQVGCKFLGELHPALIEAALALGTRN
jgi:hypothetical protein